MAYAGGGSITSPTSGSSQLPNVSGHGGMPQQSPPTPNPNASSGNMNMNMKQSVPGDSELLRTALISALSAILSSVVDQHGHSKMMEKENRKGLRLLSGSSGDGVVALFFFGVFFLAGSVVAMMMDEKKEKKMMMYCRYL